MAEPTIAATREGLDWLEAFSYEQGWRAGIAWSSARFDQAIAEALAGDHSYQATTPLSTTAKEVVQRFVRAVRGRS